MYRARIVETSALAVLNLFLLLKGHSSKADVDT